MRHPLKQLVTSFNPKEYEDILNYAKRHKLSLYGLAKKAIHEFIERHP